MQVSQEIQNRPAKPYTSKKVSDYFSNKSKCSEVFDANFIYKYTCSADQRFTSMVKHNDKFSDKLQTFAEQIKTAQYLTIFLIAYAVKTLKQFKTLLTNRILQTEINIDSGGTILVKYANNIYAKVKLLIVQNQNIFN